jgi:hypothetical protein
MSLSKRIKNEREFEYWEEASDNGRKYWFDVIGKSGGFARYVKYVDAGEVTISFVQEIYDRFGVLKEIHEKYPIDKGHIKQGE